MMSAQDTSKKQKMSKAEAARAAVLAQLEAEETKVDNGVREDGKTFAELFEASVKERDFNVGDVVSGRVLEVNNDYVLVDINYKSEGLIPFSEFQTSGGKPDIKPGDAVQVYIDKVENENGM